MIEQFRTSRPATPAPTYTFTLTFPGDHIAVLEVRGAADQESARAIARHAIRYRRAIAENGEPICTTIDYTVTDGDETRGAAAPFYLWCSAEARESQAHPRHARQLSTRTNACVVRLHAQEPDEGGAS